MAKLSKMMEGIKVALELIDNGVYEIIDSYKILDLWISVR
jgi:hypothetical protein